MKTHMLVGKTITAIHLADDSQALRFDIEGAEPIIARCDGDCCSKTFVEDVENFEAAIGSPVLSAEDIPMPEREYDHDKHEVLAFYGFKIATAKGECVIDYRNDSNGYYGGSLKWPDSLYFYGGVYSQNVSKEQWKLLQADDAVATPTE